MINIEKLPLLPIPEDSLVFPIRAFAGAVHDNEHARVTKAIQACCAARHRYGWVVACDLLNCRVTVPMTVSPGGFVREALSHLACRAWTIIEWE